jgi:hypothetical protein
MTEFEKVQEDLNEKAAEIRKIYPHYRLGQVFSVWLRLDYPDLFQVIEDTEADPWNSDDNFPAFWDAIRYMCEKG